MLTATMEQPSTPSTTTDKSADQKRPKVLSVSSPEQQPALAKPRILAQVQPVQQQPTQASQQFPLQAQPTTRQVQTPAQQPATDPRGSADPKAEAEWAEHTLSQAEKDAEELRMANDIAQAFAISENPPAHQQDKKQADAPPAPKTEPKSVPGLFYAIKGFASSVFRKITAK
jgi:hypothetical protein